MNNPCKECIVNTMCSSLCEKLFDYIYDGETTDKITKIVIHRNITGQPGPNWSARLTMTSKHKSEKMFQLKVRNSKLIQFEAIEYTSEEGMIWQRDKG